MCVQRHPCKFKCFQNYTSLCNEFPVVEKKRRDDDFICDCRCRRMHDMPCEFDRNNKQDNWNWRQDNCDQQTEWICFEKQQKKCLDKFRFCITGTVKFDGSC